MEANQMKPVLQGCDHKGELRYLEFHKPFLNVCCVVLFKLCTLVYQISSFYVAVNILQMEVSPILMLWTL